MAQRRKPTPFPLRNDIGVEFMATLLQNNETLLVTSDLVSQVRDSLRKLSYHQLDDVECAVVSEDHVTLTGKLHSYYLKQIAQTIAIKVPGVRRVTNEILVTE